MLVFDNIYKTQRHLGYRNYNILNVYQMRAKACGWGK